MSSGIRARSTKDHHSQAQEAKGRSVRSSRFAKYSRHTRFSVKVERTNLIRKSLADYVCDELEALDRALFYQRIIILAKNITEDFVTPEPSLMKVLPHGSRKDFKLVMQQEINNIILSCNDVNFTTDLMTGAFICMGDYSIILAESSEDMVCSFCKELSKIADTYWSATRVFKVEDRTGETYFHGFVCRRAQAVNINEKFPASTISDSELMAEQHFIIADKLHEAFDILTRKIASDPFAKTVHDLNTHGHSVPDLMLPPEQYNKLLPEAQRIDLVLSCTRFYRSLQEYASVVCCYIPRQEDEDAKAWPIPYSYTPTGVFQRLQYDVNLTFADYDKKEAEHGDQTESTEHEGTENKGSGGAEASGPK